ncbi:MAG: type II toxin-antitoxin system YafQ family toxin [Bacteroidota bacterium]
MYQIHYTGQFKKDLKLIKKRSVKDFELLRKIVKFIEYGGHAAIPIKHKPHILRGNFAKHWECHVLPDRIRPTNPIFANNPDRFTFVLKNQGNINKRQR